MSLKKFVAPVGIVLVAWVLWCLWLWQPERQVFKHNASLLRAFEKRDWEKVEKLIDPQFTDRWGHDHQQVILESRDVLRQFFALEITPEQVLVTSDGTTGQVDAVIHIKGSGTPLAQLAMQTVNALNSPFRFAWKRKSWKPWDWQLVTVDNPQLDVPDGGGF